MKKAKKLITALMCLIMLLSIGTTAVYAKSTTVKAQPKVKSVTSSTVNLSWSKIKGAGGYYIYKSVDGKWKKLSDTKKTAYTVKGLTASESYKFAVRHYTVKNNKKTLAKSFGTVSAKTKALSKVKSFNAKNNDSGVTLSWKKLPGATGYRIYIKNASGEWEKLATLGSGTTKYEVNKLSSFDKLYFRIRPYAKTSKGTVWGSYTSCSAPVNNSTAPKIVSSSSQPSAVTISWSSVKGASGYNIYLYSGEKYNLIGTTYGEDVTSYTVDKLNSETKYTFAVRAFKETANGAALGAMGQLYTSSTQKADFAPYRAQKVKELLNSTEFYIEYSEESTSQGRVDSVMALRMGKLYLKEIVNGVSTEYIYNSANDEVYIIDATNKKYRLASDSEEYDVLLAALHEHMKIEGMGEVSSKYKNGLACECFTESKYGRYMELTFTNDGALSEIYIKYTDGKQSTVTVSTLREETDPSLFEVPSAYTK